ncbi:hypothetical protein RND71_025201 [Anisodus tanguticus]|uniref:Uncharacterized protein n=1 Tax=Anisodus tanguticus TaxID=243964 RepID=A0AAE1VD77_9SOLA|nr:hypothetical protein RND71_025201 [Anisodus tanguticus]
MYGNVKTHGEQNDGVIYTKRVDGEYAVCGLPYIDAGGPEAYQVLHKTCRWIPVKSDAERKRVIQCLEAVIER